METQSITTETPGSTTAKRVRRVRAAYVHAARHRLPTDLDLRSRGGRRAAQLAKHFERALGSNLDETQRLAVARASTMVALLEDVRTRKVNGDSAVSVEEVLRLDFAAASALRQLGLPSSAPSTSSLADYLKHYGDEP
jgi:hypothetical protein